MITIDTGLYSFKAVEMGNPTDEPVILLHGFPETSVMWQRLQELLAENSYYSIAPDQRGYSPGARPAGKSGYEVRLLAADVIAIADNMNIEKFHLIGHDWGSAVGWVVAAEYPERIISWTALSVPHLTSFGTALISDPAQREASTYMRLFQWPIIPEIVLKANKFKNLISIWEHSSEDEVARYLSVFRQSGTVAAALNWYRANYSSLIRGKIDIGAVDKPTLFIWGTGDPAILRVAAESNKNYVTGSYHEYFIDAGHWLIQESFSQVSGRILEHLNSWRVQ
ncbi:MAG: alpha/beta hydrolase [Spirochaetales bacterium]|nr:alpha/beta hydrolase [Spirochaetales bacterium]